MVQVLHRDVKSGNVLLSEGFASAKICDVGLARVMGNTPVPSSSHNARGTFDYAAPEMLLCLRSVNTYQVLSTKRFLQLPTSNPPLLPPPSPPHALPLTALPHALTQDP